MFASLQQPTRQGMKPNASSDHDIQSFFGLNMIFNGVMWGLFTRALTLASSTVRVSIINTSANFMVTAVLGALIFSEKLPGLWWLGAAMLVAGSVIIGMREETEKKDEPDTRAEAPVLDRNSKVDEAKERVEIRGARNRASYKSKEDDISK